MFRWLDPILNPMACLPLPPDGAAASGNAALPPRLEKCLRPPPRYAMAGETRSLFQGQGLDFTDLREYLPGDDIRKIDWNVFARTLSPHVREYREEKQHTLWLVPDCTPSMRFGGSPTKLALASELALLLGRFAEDAGHRAGAMLILPQWSASLLSEFRSGESSLPAHPDILPPGRGLAQRLARRLSRIYTETPDATEDVVVTAVNRHDPLLIAFRQLERIVRKSTTVMILSDFLSLSPDWQLPLGRISRKNRLIFLYLLDTMEKALPANLGLLPFSDPETGRTAWVDTCDQRAMTEYRRAFQAHQSRVREALRSIGDVIDAETGECAADILRRLTGARRRA